MECFGFPKLRPDRSIQTKKSRVLVISEGVLSEGHTRERSWEAGDTVITRGVGGIISGTYI